MLKKIKNLASNPYVRAGVLFTFIFAAIIAALYGISREEQKSLAALDAEGYALFEKELPEEYYNFISSKFVNQDGESYEDYKMLEGVSISFYGDGGILDESTGGYTIPALTGLNFLERYVYIMGNNGETPAGIASRQGGAPMYAQPFRIPADKTPVRIRLKSEYNDNITPIIENNGGLNPCIIGGIEGEITVDDAGRVFFTRTEDGEALALSQPAVVTTRAMRNRNGDIIVVFLKELPKDCTPQEYVEILKKMEAIQKSADGSKCFYVIGPVKDIDEREAAPYEEALSAAFGNYFINAREYLCTGAIEDYEIRIRDEAYYDDIERGKVCGAFLTRNDTFNIYGNFAVANLLTNRIKENNEALLEMRMEHTE